MITSALITTDESGRQPDLYFLDGKPYLSGVWDWKKFSGVDLKVLVENTSQEDLFNQEYEALRFIYTCCRRYNEVICDRVQGFHPDSLVFGGSCHEFRGQGVNNIKNTFMDWIGWESNVDHDEPEPITRWKKYDESTSSPQNPHTNTVSTDLLTSQDLSTNPSTNPQNIRLKLVNCAILLKDEAGNNIRIEVGG